MQNKAENNPAEKIADFVQRNRKIIFIVTGVVLLLFTGFIVYISVGDYLNKRYIAQVEELSNRYEEVKYYVSDASFSGEIEALISDSRDFAKNKKGFPAGKAWSIIANINSSRNDWAQCEEAWLKAAETANKTYLGPIAYFNAAAAAQEQGKYEQAIEYLTKSVEHTFEFPSAPRAQFSIGSLYERLDNYPAALEAYRAVLINWPNLPIWQNLARSRIAAIEIR